MIRGVEVDVGTDVGVDVGVGVAVGRAATCLPQAIRKVKKNKERYRREEAFILIKDS